MLETIWYTLLFNPVLNVMILFYHYLGENLGLAILATAIVIRLILTPLIKKQTEMTKKMASLKPELQKLQEKYANNKEKLSKEQIKLYKKVGYNPVGCLGTMVPQLIVLIALIGVVRAITASDLDGLYTWVRDLIGITNGYHVETQFLFWDLTTSYNEMSSEYGRFAAESLPYIGLAIAVGIVQYFTTVFTQKMQAPPTPTKAKKTKKKGELSPDELQAQMQKSMLLMFPLMTVFITISMPAALGWYWMVQSVILIVQYFTLDFDKNKKGIQNMWNTLFKKEPKLKNNSN
jgi:YidC/Oxa1 family membrane protein insertase